MMDDLLDASSAEDIGSESSLVSPLFCLLVSASCSSVARSAAFASVILSQGDREASSTLLLPTIPDISVSTMAMRALRTRAGQRTMRVEDRTRKGVSGRNLALGAFEVDRRSVWSTR